MPRSSLAVALLFAAGFVAPAIAQDPFKAQDVFGPRSGVSNPSVIFEMKPKYTQDALRAKIQGVAEVEAIILEDGTVGQARIHKSLDKQFGLDAEALEAAKAWRFKPAMKDGAPVKFLVIIQLEFRTGSQSLSDAVFVGGAYRQATPGLVMPRVTHEEKPKYTSEAMRRKIQGVVEIQAVVGPDGKVDRVRVEKSLDKEYGLDEEALRAARGWTFEPGTLNGKPVPVLVIVQLEFRIDK